MEYSATAQWDGRVWAIVRALSGCERKASSLSFSLAFFISLFLPLVLFLSLSSHFGLGLYYFIIFKHVTFLARLFSLSFTVSLLLPLSGRGGTTLQKNMLEIVQSRRLALLGALLMWIDGRIPGGGWNLIGGAESRIFFHVHTLLLEMVRVRARS